MEPIVELTAGKVRGRSTGGVTAYLGIPYAEAPTGAAAFAAPARVTPWDGVRDATTQGATAPQPPYDPPFDQLLSNPLHDGPEFLNVNVWTPGGSGLPVMVWLPGGAFRNGSNAVPTYDGTAFARDGVVLVSVNYRLGVQGFGVVQNSPHNRGLLDQLAALAWVQENIAAFGGDPDRVTLFGQSAGGMSVATLLSIPASRGFFQRAIVQSGTAQAVASATEATFATAEVAKRLGVEASAAGLGSVPLTELIATQGAVAAEMRQNPDPERWGPSVVSAGGGIMPFFPVIDGELIHERPIDAIAKGAAHGIDLMVGTTTEEFRLFTVPTGLAATITAEALPVLTARMGLAPAIAETYATNRPGLSPGELFAAISSDAFFGVPTRRLAEAHQDATFAYEFDWRTPVGGLGACHALELPFVFDTLGTGSTALTGPNAPQELADGMHAAWVAFAISGDPGWPQYDTASRAVMTFGQPASVVIENPRANEYALWTGRG